MSKTTWCVLTVAQLLIRSIAICYLLTSDNIAYKLLACLEGVAVVFGALNLAKARCLDEGFGAVWIPACYLAGMFLVPRCSEVSITSLCMMVFAVCLNTWALFCLRSRFTVAGSSWVSLCDYGPYRFIRHPQQASRLVYLLAVLLSLSDLGALPSLGLAAVLSISVIFTEEVFLSTVGEYAPYRARVPWMVLPGVA